jgi:hypothetical protein
LDAGRALREAREQLGVTLAEIRDRTGVSWQNLEALESMDLARMPDQRTVVTAARRYSEVVGLDAAEICGTALRVWQDQQSEDGAMQAATPTTGDHSRRHLPGSAATGPTMGRSVMGDTGAQAHLRAFTQTAEIPVTSGVRAFDDGTALLHFADTNAVPIISREQPRALRSHRWFRTTLGFTTLLLLVGVLGLAAHHYEPQWLADIHVTRSHSPAVTAKTGSVTPGQSRRSSQVSASAPPSLITQTEGPAGSASVVVRTKSYQVLISAQRPCWIDATVPPDVSRPLFVDVLQAGGTKTLAPVRGELAIEFGASFVTVQIQVMGRTVPGWTFTPPEAPFSLSFATYPGP